MGSHHLPDPALFWVTAALIVVAAVWLLLRRRDPAGWVFVVLLALLAVTFVDFAMVLHNWPAGGLTPPDPPESLALPEGLGLPPLFWSLKLPLLLVGAVLVAGLVPHRRAWLPPSPYQWVAAAAFVGLVFLVESLEFERLTYLRNLFWGLVFPLVGLRFLADALHARRHALGGLLLLALAFFAYAVPTGILQALDARRELDAGRLPGPLGEIWVADLVGGVVIVAIALGAAGWALTVAWREKKEPRALAGFALGVGALVLGGLLIWLDWGDWTAKRVFLELGSAALFAILGAAGLMLVHGQDGSDVGHPERRTEPVPVPAAQPEVASDPE